MRLAESLRRGEGTPGAWVAECLARIAERDTEIRAWVEVAPRPGTGDGPLRGVPFGAKDIIETRGMATEYGSPLFAGRRGTEDAAVIAELQRMGAILLGKTHTAAFASFDPAPTRNPRVPGHTPGGSSSGSAAAVAAGMVPFALGTQTLGSVIRPASYCQICGFKPTFGRLPMRGVLAFAPSLDTFGLFTETAEDMACLWARSWGRPEESRVPRMGRVGSVPMPAGWDALSGTAQLINDYEGARTHRAMWERHGDAIGVRLADLVRRGLGIAKGEYAAARRHVDAMRAAMAHIFDDYPVLLSPAATGPPPQGLDSTGDPSANAPWTALGVPAITVPIGRVGLQMTAAWGCDDELVAWAAALEQSGEALAASLGPHG